jgi:hypothetical protein
MMAFAKNASDAVCDDFDKPVLKENAERHLLREARRQDYRQAR